MLIRFLVGGMMLALTGLVLLRCLAGWGLPLPNRAPAGAVGAAQCPPERGRELQVFLFALAVRLAVLLAFAAAIFLAAKEPVAPEALLSRFELWDARHYLNLIEQGYAGYQEDGQHLFLVFFPAYVWICRLLSLVMPTLAAGLLVSVLSFGWGCCYVYRLGRMFYGEEAGWQAVLLLCAFPFSFFYGAVMTEGLFLLATAAACYYAACERWLAFGLWGALAAAARMTGVLVILFAAARLLCTLQPLRPPVWASLRRAAGPFLRRLPLLCMPLLGTACYLLLNWRVDGDPFAFTVHIKHWSNGGMWLPRVVEYLVQYAKNEAASPLGWSIWLPTLALFGGIFALLWLSAVQRSQEPALLLFSLGYFTANFSLSWLLSAGRYCAGGFAFFLLLAGLLKDRPRLRELLLFAGCLFLGVYLYAYANGAQIM